MNFSRWVRSWTLVTLVVPTLFFCGCGDNARIATRNVQEMGKYLAEYDDATIASMGRVIAAEAGAAADSYDAMLLGLWNNRSKPSVTVKDLQADVEQGLKDNIEHTKTLEEETKTAIVVGSWMEQLITLGLGLLLGGGAGGIALAQSRGKLKTALTVAKSAIKFGYDMTHAETNDAAEKVKLNHVREQRKLGIKSLVEAELDSIKDAEKGK